jgi:hypothetical protein
MSEHPYNRTVFERYAQKLQGKRIIHTNSESIIPRNEEQLLKIEFKPEGLWYSCGDSWVEWCFREQFFSCFGDNIFEVIVDESALLKITNLKEFDAFVAEYGCEFDDIIQLRNPEYKSNLFAPPSGFRLPPNCIRWDKMAEKYSGIEINPYLWEKRLDGGVWYYCWDCASGCIWDKEAVLQVDLIAKYHRFYPTRSSKRDKIKAFRPSRSTPNVK